jgi:hypothetical protein
MLLQEKIIIRVNPKNYKNLEMYNFSKFGDLIEINICDLSKNSHLIVECLCDVCGNKKNIQYKSYISNVSKYNYYTCSTKCAVSKNEKTNLLNMGCLYPAQDISVRDKYKNTMLERYGVDNSLKMAGVNNLAVERSKSIKSKEKRKNTNEIKWGSDNISKTEFFFNKTKIGNDGDFIEYLKDNICLFMCNNGHTFEISTTNYHNRINDGIKICTICNPIGESKSIKEKELLEYIKSIYFQEIISSYRDGLEIDIFLTDLKIGFEFNGLYWHSSKFKDVNYHSNKTDYFKDKDIRIIHIWEDDWLFKKDIVESQIKNILKLNCEKIFARKCFIKEIKDSKIVSKFLNKNHVQGKVNSSLKLGLYHNEELVSIMTFDHFEGRKKMEEDGWNLSRFCNKLNTNVIGGASKLLNYFIKTYNPSRIVSYADKDWSIGALYQTLGFENVGGNGPDYKYIVDGKRVHKSRYKKSKLNTELTESKQMELNGINKIFDCGKIKFEKNNKN